jgi:ribosomal protein L11 methyltransferase
VGACAPGGRIVLSGLLREQADSVASAYAALGAAELRREEIGDWATLVLSRRPA